MSSPEILFILRALSALILLGLLCLLIWFLYQDVRSNSLLLSQTEPKDGTLKVIESECDSLPTDSEIKLSPTTSIGRAVHSTVLLEDQYASSQHALIYLKDGRWWIEDLNSRNGTHLNDYLLESATVLASGDLIRIGNTLIRVEI